MTLTELRYIVTLAQEQHFGRAADRCHVSQPTLSIAVKKLEQELGVELFERSKSSVYPTPTGEKVISQAQRVLEEAMAIQDIASAGKDQLNSLLSIGAIFTIGPYLFPHMIPALRQIAPRMPLVVEESYTATLRQRLRKGELDVIVIALPFTEPDVVTQPLYEEPLVLLMPESHPLTKFDEIDHQQLDDQNVLMLGEGHCLRDNILDTIPTLNKPHPNTTLINRTEGSSLETLRHMVASGLGITIIPWTAVVGTTYPGLVTRPFSGTQPHRTVALAWRASFPRHKAIDSVREAIKKNSLPPL